MNDRSTFCTTDRDMPQTRFGEQGRHRHEIPITRHTARKLAGRPSLQKSSAQYTAGIDAPGSHTRPTTDGCGNTSRQERTSRADSPERSAGKEGGGWLAQRFRRYEAINDVAGRLASPVRAGSLAGGRVDTRDNQVPWRRLRAALPTPRCVCSSSRSNSSLITRHGTRDGAYAPNWRIIAPRSLRICARKSRIGWRITLSSSHSGISQRPGSYALEPTVRPDHLRTALQGHGRGARNRADAEPA